MRNAWFEMLDPDGFKHSGDKKICLYKGGFLGNPGKSISKFVKDPIGSIGGLFEDTIEDVSREVGNFGSSVSHELAGLDDAVNENLPGGWLLPIVVVAAYYGVPPEMFEGLTTTATATEAGVAAGGAGAAGGASASTAFWQATLQGLVDMGVPWEIASALPAAASAAGTSSLISGVQAALTGQDVFKAAVTGGVFSLAGGTIANSLINAGVNATIAQAAAQASVQAMRNGKIDLQSIALSAAMNQVNPQVAKFLNEQGIPKELIPTAMGAFNQALLTGEVDPAKLAAQATGQFVKGSWDSVKNDLKDNPTPAPIEDRFVGSKEYQETQGEYKQAVQELLAKQADFDKDKDSYQSVRDQISKIDEQYQPIVAEKNSYIDERNALAERYDTYDARKAEFETPVQTGGDGQFGLDVVQQGGDDDIRILRDARGALYTPSRDGDDWVLRRIDSAFLEDKDQIYNQAVALKEKIDALTVKANELRTNAEPLISQAKDLWGTITTKDAELSKLADNIYTPKDGNLAQKMQEVNTQQQATYDAWLKEQAENTRVAEEKRVAETTRLAEEKRAADAKDIADQAILNAQKNIDKVIAPPVTPDIVASTDPAYDAIKKLLEEPISKERGDIYAGNDTGTMASEKNLLNTYGGLALKNNETIKSLYVDGDGQHRLQIEVDNGTDKPSSYEVIYDPSNLSKPEGYEYNPSAGKTIFDKSKPEFDADGNPVKSTEKSNLPTETTETPVKPNIPVANEPAVDVTSPLDVSKKPEVTPNIPTTTTAPTTTTTTEPTSNLPVSSTQPIDNTKTPTETATTPTNGLPVKSDTPSNVVPALGTPVGSDTSGTPVFKNPESPTGFSYSDGIPAVDPSSKTGGSGTGLPVTTSPVTTSPVVGDYAGTDAGGISVYTNPTSPSGFSYSDGNPAAPPDSGQPSSGSGSTVTTPSGGNGLPVTEPNGGIFVPYGGTEGDGTNPTVTNPLDVPLIPDDSIVVPESPDTSTTGSPTTNAPSSGGGAFKVPSLASAVSSGSSGSTAGGGSTSDPTKTASPSYSDPSKRGYLSPNLIKGLGGDIQLYSGLPSNLINIPFKKEGGEVEGLHPDLINILMKRGVSFTPGPEDRLYARHPTRGFAVGGAGTGQSDDIPTMLSDGEYVIDADTVAALGDGSSKAGALALDKMREEIRKHKRSAPTDKIPPKAKSPLEYLNLSRRKKHG